MLEKNTEIAVENHIREIISNKIIGIKNYFTLLDSKNVSDIIICRNIIIPKIFFIEVKHYSKKKGRIGFGDASGAGFQSEILKKRPRYLEENLIWVFQKENDKKFYVSNNNECIKYISGGSIGNKNNNFQLKIFDHIKSYDEKGFITFLEGWLLK